GVREVESLVQDLSRDDRSQLAGREALEGVTALTPADLAGDRHDQVVTGDLVGALVVRGEHEDARGPVLCKQPGYRPALGCGEGEQGSRCPPGRYRASALAALPCDAQEVLPVGAWLGAHETCDDGTILCAQTGVFSSFRVVQHEPERHEIEAR